MIVYEHGLLGLGTLGNVHGSAAYKVIIPAVFSTGIYFGYYHYLRRVEQNEQGSGSINEKVIENTYAISVLIAFVSFLLTFKLNFSYGRYWEATTAVHNMMIRFVDCATTCAAFHYQSIRYEQTKPQHSFGTIANNANNNNNNNSNNNNNRTGTPIITDPNRVRGHSREHIQSSIHGQAQETLLQKTIIERIQKQKDELKHSKHNFFWDRIRGKKRNVNNNNNNDNNNNETNHTNTALTSSLPKSISLHHRTLYDDYLDEYNEVPIPMLFQAQFQLERNKVDYGLSIPNTVTSTIASSTTTTTTKSHPKTIPRTASTVAHQKMLAPSLFLQELIHLLSLLNAVALSTLRNDIEGTPTPLTEHLPGKPLPPVDNDIFSRDGIRAVYGEGTILLKSIYFLFGNSRSDTRRTMYNAVRPFSVLGGVSDNEIEQIQQCRGPSAKVALCNLWIQEYISREHLNGSTGAVAPPIVARVFNLISDGIISYNHARKIAYVPFPFPNAQIASFFTVAIMFIFPLLYTEYVSTLWFGSVLNFLTVLCFLGLHETGRELENPFINVPNDIPLLNMQSRFNEALVTIYAGYHPDSWWEIVVDDDDDNNNNNEQQQRQQLSQISSLSLSSMAPLSRTLATAVSSTSVLPQAPTAIPATSIQQQQQQQLQAPTIPIEPPPPPPPPLVVEDDDAVEKKEEMKSEAETSYDTSTATSGSMEVVPLNKKKHDLSTLFMSAAASAATTTKDEDK